MSNLTFHRYKEFILKIQKAESEFGRVYYIGKCDSIKFYKESQSVPFLIGRFESYVDDVVDKKEDKPMNVKFTLWDAVEHNERIELLLTRLEDEFKKLNQKGYKTNINVQEKLKEIDKQINFLLEEQSKLNNQEDKFVMKIKCGYKAHTVDITKDSVGYHCTVIDNGKNDNLTLNRTSLENLVKQYKNFVDEKDPIEENSLYKMSLEVIYKDETLEFPNYNPWGVVVKEYIADANFTPRTGTFSLDKFVDQFIDYVDKKENKPMHFPYKGYRLEIESKEEDGATRLIGRCTKTGWMLSTLGGYDYMIDRYKKDIVNHIEATQRQKEIDEKKMKEAREIPDLLKSIDKKLDKVVSELSLVKKIEVRKGKTVDSCHFLVQKILKNTPESVNDLFDLLLDFKFKTEEGIGEKE